MIIEEASESDLQEILDLQKLAFQIQGEIYNDFTIPPLVQTLEEIKNDFLLQVFLKTEKDGKIIGSVRGFKIDDSCYIGRLIVHPDYQNQGIGSKLLNEIERAFTTVSRYELFTGHKSEKEIYFYQKQGYSIFKKEKVDEILTMVYFEKKREQ